MLNLLPISLCGGRALFVLAIQLGMWEVLFSGLVASEARMFVGNLALPMLIFFTTMTLIEAFANLKLYILSSVVTKCTLSKALTRSIYCWLV